MEVIPNRFFSALTITREKAEKIISRAREKAEIWRYIEVSLTLFVIAFFVIFAIRPAATTIAGLVGEIKEKEVISLKMRQKINAVVLAQEAYAGVQEKIGPLDSFLPTNFNLAQGLAQFAGPALESGVSAEAAGVSELAIAGELATTKEAKEKPKEKQSNLLSFDFNFRAKGEYKRLLDFFRAALSSRRWFEISQYQIAKPQKKEETENLILNLSGKMFYWGGKY